MVRGCWSGIDIILLWSGVGGPPLTSSCCGQALVVSYWHHLAVVRGLLSAMNTLLERTLGRAFGKNANSTEKTKKIVVQVSGQGSIVGDFDLWFF